MGSDQISGFGELAVPHGLTDLDSARVCGKYFPDGFRTNDRECGSCQVAIGEALVWYGRSDTVRRRNGITSLLVGGE